MPIISSDRFSGLKPRIMRHIRKVLQSSALRFRVDTASILTVGFALDVKTIKAGVPISGFNQPEGIRVLLLNGREVVYSLDLFLVSGKLKFSHAVTGPALDGLVNALNALEARYREDGQRIAVTVLEFPLGREQYFMAGSGSTAVFYKYHNDTLTTMTRERLQEEIDVVISARKPITP
jgi:hypothetical protein